MVSFVLYFNPRFQQAFPKPIFPFFFAGLISLKTPSLQPLSTPLVSLTVVEAATVGKSFSSCLSRSKTAEDGVDLFKSQFPCVQELCAVDPSFASLLLAVGRRKILVAPWGMKWRVWLGSSLSVLDMTTDIVTIVNFYAEGRGGFARASIGMIALSLGLQVLMVRSQGRRRGAVHVCREVFIVLSTLKPAVDAYRVTVGEEKHKDDLVSPFAEMMLAKVAEM